MIQILLPVVIFMVVLVVDVRVLTGRWPWSKR